MEWQVDGRRAYAYTGGKAPNLEQPCVVFIHGALHDHSVWNLLARWFAHHGHTALAVDQPSHGRSEGPLLPSIEMLADWVLELIHVAGFKQAAMVGHSMGSLIALEAAARAPTCVSRLAMIGTAYPMNVSESLLDSAARRPESGMDMVNAFSFSTTAPKPSYPGPGMWLHGANRQLMGRMQGLNDQQNVFLHDFTLCNAYRNGLQAAGQVKCPAHLVLGAADQMTPPKATRELVRTLAAQVHTLPGGHAIMQEQPEALLHTLRQVLLT